MSSWASSPDLSSSSTFQVGWDVASTLPRRLWDAYVTYLWCYQSSSWVGRVASTFRILAVVLILPVVLLTLLSGATASSLRYSVLVSFQDVTSYVIVRTLGVIDDIKASTIDPNTITPTTAANGDAGGVAVQLTARASESLAPEDLVQTQPNRDGAADGDGRGGCVSSSSETTVGTSPAPVSVSSAIPALTERDRTVGAQRLRSADGPSHAYYFAGEEDLRLAGEGVFSPAVSGPPSPLTPRVPLHTFSEGEVNVTEETIMLRRRTQGAREDEVVHA